MRGRTSPARSSRRAISTAAAAHPSAPHDRIPRQGRQRGALHRQPPLTRGDVAGQEVHGRLLHGVGGLGPGGQRLPGELKAPTCHVGARQSRQEESRSPVVARQSLDDQRPVGVLLRLVERSPQDRDLGQRRQGQAQLERVVDPVGDLTALEGARLGLVQAPEPGEDQGDAEQRTTGQHRVGGGGAWRGRRRPRDWRGIRSTRTGHHWGTHNAVVARAYADRKALYDVPSESRRQLPYLTGLAALG